MFADLNLITQEGLILIGKHIEIRNRLKVAEVAYQKADVNLNMAKMRDDWTLTSNEHNREEFAVQLGLKLLDVWDKQFTLDKLYQEYRQIEKELKNCPGISLVSSLDSTGNW